jgi:hypothetical protein
MAVEHNFSQKKLLYVKDIILMLFFRILPTSSKWLCMYAGLIYLGSAAPAHAYVDPGSGTFILQLLAAMAFGTLFYIRQIVTQIKAFFSKLFGLNNGPED